MKKCFQATPFVSSLSASTIIFYVLVLFLGCKYGVAIMLPNNETVPAIIAFGDSIVDCGNNNGIQTIMKSNFPPYGRDFRGGQPTGRFSNGKVPADIITEELGIKEILPAYLDPNVHIQDLLTGVSFASGASGYDPLTAKIASVLSLSDQVKLFKQYIEKIKGAVGEGRASNILSKSIFVVSSGSDDIANTYFLTPFRRADYDISLYTDLMVSAASGFFQELYGLGARRIGVIGAPPIGCLPSQRTLGGGIKRGCVDSYNQAAILFNSKLSSEIDSLNKKLPQARLVYFDIYKPLLALIQNPAQFGFETESIGCCGTGLLEVIVFCNQFLPTCTDADKYIFWDSFHPTEKAYKILVPQILSKGIKKFF